jgi:hypothetical protein
MASEGAQGLYFQGRVLVRLQTSTQSDEQIQRIRVITLPVVHGEAEAAMQQPVWADDKRQR